MKRLISIVLLLAGLLLLIQSEAVTEAFLAQSFSNVNRTDYDDVRLSLVEQRTGLMVRSSTGSLTGCFVSWLFWLYLRTRWLERELLELREQVQRDAVTPESGCQDSIPPVSPDD